MFKIDSSGAVGTMPTPAATGTFGYFSEGSPGVADATVVTADWLNAVQEELVHVILTAGLSLSKTNSHQLLPAIQALIASASSGASFGTNGWQVFPGGLIVQWGSYSGTVAGSLTDGVAEASISVTWPIAFPTAALQVFVTPNDVNGVMQETAWAHWVSRTGGTLGLSCRSAGAAMTGRFFVIGY